MKISPQEILIKDFTYEIPETTIAEFPLEQRDQSRLLVYKTSKFENHYFNEISNLLPAYSTLILNNTRVIEARILFQKSTGGVIEIFCLEPYLQSIEEAIQRKVFAQWECMIGGASKWKAGQVLTKQIFVENKKTILSARYVEKQEENFIIEFSWEPNEFSFLQIIHAAGAIPLPPYIKRAPEKLDEERYQTVFAKEEGSVAAPTAALHFSDKVFEDLKKKNIDIEFITLHVGAGTFKPVKSESIADHTMHSEPFTVSQKLIQSLINAKTIIAVGTTSLRTLESLYWIGLKLIHEPKEDFILEQWEAYELEEKYPDEEHKNVLTDLLEWMKKKKIIELHCRTSLIIVPGYKFKIPSALITNFHQPQSTLLLLVAAFIGPDWKKVYQHALENNYRFLSYGDSSLLWRSQL